MWLHTSVILTLGRQKQDCCDLGVRLVYLVFSNQGRAA